MSREERMYRFDAADRTGVFLGLGVLQLAILGATAVSATVMVSAGIPLIPVVALVAVAVVLAVGRFAGERLVDWLPVLAGWARNRRSRRWRARLHPLTADEWGHGQPELPAILSGLRLGPAGDSWGRLAGSGIVHDQHARTMSAVMRVHARGFALASRDEQVRLLAGWGDVIAAFATERGAVSRLAWSDFATPAGVGEHLRWLEDQAAPSGAAARSYRALLESFAADIPHHDLTITVTVDADRLTRSNRGSDVDTRLLSALLKAVESLARAGRHAGITVGDPLASGELATMLRTRFDPQAMRRRAGHDTGLRGPLATRLGLVDPAGAGPLAVETSWNGLRTDGSWHRAYWISDWPRLLQHPDWMEPILGFSGGRSRAITIIFEPVAPSAARRRVDRDAIKLESDAASREDKGRRVSGGHRRLQQAVEDREAELVAGYAEVAYAGIVIVSAPDADALAEACDETEQIAREHGLDVRALDGRHDLAFAAGLPLGVGIAREWLT